MICTADGKFISNPLRSTFNTIQKVDQEIERKKKDLLYVKLYLNNIQAIWWKLKKKFINYNERNHEISLHRSLNVALHGSCLIFSPKYFEHFRGFNNKTFLYNEENIIFQEIRAKNGIMVYNPNLVIYHKEDASVDALIIQKRRKRLFVLNNEIKSLYILREIMSKDYTIENDEKIVNVRGCNYED